MTAPGNPKREAFFLPSKIGGLFSIYYYTLDNSSEKGNILYIHPFADEMNKSRRMAALQAVSFARAGFGVLQIDLLGCGDSQGEFGDATWDAWKDNINTAVHWLNTKGKGPISLWGLRLGALLMMDWVKGKSVPIEKYIFWQPVLNGATAIHQFFRLASASRLMGKDGESSKEIREKINQGQAVEIGGYQLNQDLVRAIENIKMEDLCPPEGSLIVWKEISLNDPADIGPASRRVIEFLEQKGCRIEAEPIIGNAFWNSVEISTLPDLIASTTKSIISV
jgi:exosortase A-associated hydrolase 2